MMMAHKACKTVLTDDAGMNKAHVVEDGRRGAPIANFHRRAFLGSENAYLELSPGYEGTLDSLIGTRQ